MSTIVLRIDTTALHEGAIEDLMSALYAQVEGTGAFVISHLPNRGRYLGERVRLTRDCELGKEGVVATVVAVNHPYMSLRFDSDRIVHTGSDYSYLETDMTHRWTVKGASGRCLAHEGVPTMSIIQERNAFPSVAIDMLTAYMCDVLNATDLDHLMRVWNDDPRFKK